jgi:hypothetical protein
MNGDNWSTGGVAFLDAVCDDFLNLPARWIEQRWRLERLFFQHRQRLD